MYRRNKNHEGSDAILAAIKKANIPALQKALFYGLDPNRREQWSQETPLHCAVTPRPETLRSQETTRVIIQILLEAGADHRLKDHQHHTPFELACIWENHGAALALLDSEYSKVVLNQRAVNRTLHRVVEPLGRYGLFYIEALRMPVEGDRKGFAVHWANQRELLRRILSMPGVNVNSRRHRMYGRNAGVKLTPLHAALEPGIANGRGVVMPEIGIVKMILEAGARRNATISNRSQKDALSMVVEALAVEDWSAGNPTAEEVVDFVELLISHGARPDAGAFRQAPWFAFFFDVRGMERDGIRINAVVKSMLEAKQPGNPTEWLLKRRLVDKITAAIPARRNEGTRRGTQGNYRAMPGNYVVFV